MLQLFQLACACVMLIFASVVIKDDETKAIIKWETGYEIAAYGFYVYRDGNTLLNDTIIPAQKIGLIEGAEYRFVDENVPCGKHFYRIVLVHADQTTEYMDTTKIRRHCGCLRR